MPEPNAEQLEAIEKYRATFGLIWKELLLGDWLRSGYHYDAKEYSHLLQQVRNQFGKSWLASYRPEELLMYPRVKRFKKGMLVRALYTRDVGWDGPLEVVSRRGTTVTVRSETGETMYASSTNLTPA